MLTGGPGLLLAAFTLTKYGNIQTTICSVSLKFSAIAEAVYTYRDNQLISVNSLIVYKRQENKTASGNSVVVFFFSFFFFSVLRESVDPGWAFYFVKDRAPLAPLPCHNPPLLAHRADPGRHGGPFL